MQRVNAPLSLLAKFVVSLSITGLFALSSAAIAAPGDVADGYCDGFKGKQRALCVKAHASAKQVERLETEGSTVKQLNKANAKLAKALGAFEALTGFGVPGLAPECEIPELVSWWETQQERVANGVLNAEPVASSDTAGTCRLAFEFQSAYTDGFKCTSEPTIILRDRNSAVPYNVAPVYIVDGSLGQSRENDPEPTTVTYEDGTTYTYSSVSFCLVKDYYVIINGPLDYSTFRSDAEIGACARAYGCDAF